MFCNKCGANLPENAKFCGMCGASIAAPVAPVAEPAPVVAPPAPVVEPTPVEAPVAPVATPAATVVMDTPAIEPISVETPAPAEVPAVPQEPPVTPAVSAEPAYVAMPPMEIPAPKKKSKKGLLIALIAVVVVAAIGVGGFFLLCGNPYQAVVEDYAKLSFDGDLSKLESLAPPQAWNALMKEKGVSVQQLMTDAKYTAAAQEELKESREYFEKIVGAGFTVTADVTCDHEVTEHDRANILSDLVEKYSIMPSQVGDIRFVHTEYHYEGSITALDLVGMATFVEIDGVWYEGYYNYYADYYKEEYEMGSYDYFSFDAYDVAVGILNKVEEQEQSKETDDYDYDDEDVELDWS